MTNQSGPSKENVNMFNIVDESLSTIAMEKLNHSSQNLNLQNAGKPQQIRKSASISRLQQNNRVVNIVTPGGLLPKKK